MNTLKFAKKLAIPLFVALAYGPSQGLAQSILGTELTSFAVLGQSAVTIAAGATTVWGNLGLNSATSPTGLENLTINGIPGLASTSVLFGTTGATLTAQSQLTTARTNIDNVGSNPLTPTTQLLLSDLGGLTLTPGVYSFSAFAGGFAALTGTLTLDGQNNANAGWVFQMDSTLITAANSEVKVINTGTGAGVYWNVGSSATLGANSTFEGNILAVASIGLGTGARITCGRALADNAAVTMDGTNGVSIGCLGTGEEGSNGLSGGFTVNGGIATPLPVVALIPEPETYAMLLAGLGLMGFVARRRQRNLAAAA